MLQRHRAPLHAAALGMLGHGKAEDAVQETFAVALRRIGDLRDPDAVGGWLHAVLRNVCLMTVRRERALELTGEIGRPPAFRPAAARGAVTVSARPRTSSPASNR